MTRLPTLALTLFLPAAALAQAPQVTVRLDPEGPVTVGTPLAITATILVPTWMPDPPAWPALQIADAMTRLPERATHPVTERVGHETWSGVARTWEIVPQRAGDYDLGQPQVAITYADPATSQPVAATLDLPAIAFPATIPAGAEGLDPFIPATGLTVTATVDGLPETPKPGDSFTLTVTTEAAGPPAILLPPLAGRIATPDGLRAYPREPALADGATATRTEATTYVVERPGTYALPAISLDWWNLGSATRETAATDPIALTVPAPPGWRDPAAAQARRLPLALGAAAVAAIALALGARLLRHRRARPPSETELYRALRRAIRSEPVPVIRNRLATWQAALPHGTASPEATAALHALERRAYGPPGESPATGDPRRDLLGAVERMRPARPRRHAAPLPALNPPSAAGT